jgi:hypothetical protein
MPSETGRSRGSSNGVSVTMVLRRAAATPLGLESRSVGPTADSSDSLDRMLGDIKLAFSESGGKSMLPALRTLCQPTQQQHGNLSHVATQTTKQEGMLACRLLWAPSATICVFACASRLVSKQLLRRIQHCSSSERKTREQAASRQARAAAAPQVAPIRGRSETERLKPLDRPFPNLTFRAAKIFSRLAASCVTS